MNWLRNVWTNPRFKQWIVMAICFALGLLVGWFAADYWLDRWVGINL